MFNLKRLLAAAILMLWFLAGHQVALRAQCQQCYRTSGPAGQLDPTWFILGQCPCTEGLDCIYFECDCDGIYWGNSRCGISPPPSYCIGC